MFPRIYLDNNATTPLDPRVVEFVEALLSDLKGNPSSMHADGRYARALITNARDAFAAFLGVKSQSILFTSSGTESANLALFGLMVNKPKGHIITSVAEHSCTLAACKRLESMGHPVTYLPTGAKGHVSPGEVDAAMRSDTALIALMAVNNETGVRTDIETIASLCLHRQIQFFVDAVAQLGKEQVEIFPGVSAMGFSGHKIHALQGVGALYVRPGIKLQSMIVGGGQELGRRAGTENVLGIASFGKAVELLASESPEAYRRMEKLRISFERQLQDRLPAIALNGEGERTSNVSNIAFSGIDGEALLIALDQAGLSASHGSACSSGSLEPSRVLLAMGIPHERVRSSVRFSFGRLTQEADVDRACEMITSCVAGLSRKG